jgi:outer membrane protein assembly factor BamB
MLPRLAAGAFLVLAGSFAAALAEAPSSGHWPQWRGPNRDAVSLEQGFLKEWPADGPKVVWHVEHVGIGFSSLAVQDGRIYTQGDLAGVEHVICLDAKDGSIVWTKMPEPVERQLAERVAKELMQADANSDGTIDEAEALARLGWNFNQSDTPQEGPADQIAAARAGRLFDRLDTNGDGRLSFEEAGPPFRDTFSQIDTPADGADVESLARGRARTLLQAADADQDGRVVRKEAGRTLLERPFNQIDQKLEGQNKGDELLTAEEIEAWLLKTARGHDGLLSRGELAAYYTRVFPGRDGSLTATELRGHYGGYRNSYGDGPRGTPTLDGSRVYAEGGNGDLTCFDAASGQTLWHVNLAADFGGGRPGWGYAESPLVEGDWVIVTPGGKQGTLLALNKHTGQPVWQSASIQEGAQYSSPIVSDLAGTRQVVQFARNRVFGVRLSDGQLLWSYSAPSNGTANICTPVAFENHVFATSAYGTGGGLAQIIASGDGQRAEEVYFEKKMAVQHGGVVRVGDYLYGFGSGLICMHYLTGEIAWTARSVGKGSLVYADGMLYLLGEGHQVALCDATPEEYRERGRFKIPNHGRPSWAHPVVAGGRLYLRNLHELTAYDVSAK